MPWFLGSDGQTSGIIESLATDYGAKIFDLTEARRSGLLRPPAAGSGLLVPAGGNNPSHCAECLFSRVFALVPAIAQNTTS